MNILEKSKDILNKYEEELTSLHDYESSEGIDSPETIKAYCNDVKRFLKYLNYKDVSEISSKDVDDFLKLDAPSTANRRMMSISNFYKFLNESEITENCPIIKGKTYRKLRKIPKRMSVHMTKEETFKFMVEAAKKIKYYAMMMMFINTGMREAELCNLKRKNYDGKFIKYIAKGGEERVQALGSEVTNIVDEYLKTRNDDIEYLFISSWNRKYSKSRIYTLVKDITKNAGINKEITPHKLRHTCAAAMRTDGKDIYDIMRKLGQKDTRTTEIYLRTLVDERDIEVAEKGSFNVDFRKQIET